MDLRELLRVLRERKLMLIILPLVAMITSGIISWYFIPPKYEASTTLIVGKNQSDQNLATDYAQILANRQLVKTYREIAKSGLVSRQIIQEAKLNLTPAEVNRMIQVDLVEETELIRITVEDVKPSRTALIANTAAEVFMAEVVNIINAENVKILEPAYLPKNPVKPNKKLNVLIAAVVGVICAVGLIVIREYLDTTIKSPEDVQRYLDLPVLGTIPQIKKFGRMVDV